MKVIQRTILATAISCALITPHVNAGALMDIYQQALAQDPQLKAAEAASLAGQEALPQGRAGLLPTISLTGNTTWIDYDSTSYNENYHNHGYTVSLSQPLFSAAAWFTYQQGIAQSEAAALQFGQAQQSLILRVVNSYLSVLRAQTALQTSQAQERAIKRRLDQVNAQFEVGLIAITDVQEAQASYDNAKVARILAEGDLDNTFQALARLTGQAVGNIDPLAKDYPVENISPIEPQAWIDKARAGNLALQIAQANTEAARRQSQAARSGHLPTLSLTASHDKDSGSYSSNDHSETNQIGLTLSMPIFSGGATSSQSRQAEYGFTEAQYNQDDALREVILETRNLLRNLQTNVLSVAARKQSILSSETALKATEEGFNVGTRNVVDVLQAEQQLYSAQRDYADARFDYVANLFNFKQQIGTLSPEDIIGLDQWMKAE
ncbi:TolC family outer membrane protein [Amphritea sp. 1_MG-2023]|uniref:TolC family outer membrane protein n=1 Tax=Amphritea sp. 1_MG-2023 TaxID=3062670 RepID=UPI0026E364A6|nr:TolC family outer membrane protein [Amphritea sp. 1_MG-2023]MDO6563582.1 TolC family outer membrane protein [Amphritea sp. 1_MG-2023]